jgi:hypothetical protein
MIERGCLYTVEWIELYDVFERIVTDLLMALLGGRPMGAF